MRIDSQAHRVYGERLTTFCGRKAVENTAKMKPFIWKTVLTSAVVILTNVIGNYGLTRGLREVGVIESWSPAPYIRAFAHPWIAIGVVLMVAWLIARLMLLSWADLTFVLPVISFSYVLSALAGVILLHEPVSPKRWAGIILITVGAGLVAFTYPKTAVPNAMNASEHKN